MGPCYHMCNKILFRHPACLKYVRSYKVISTIITFYIVDLIYISISVCLLLESKYVLCPKKCQ